MAATPAAASLGSPLPDATPTDGISSLAWLDTAALVTGNWDASVRLFRASASSSSSSSSPSSSSSSSSSSAAAPLAASGAWRAHKAPVLTVCAGPRAGSVLSGGIDEDVRLSYGEPSSGAGSGIGAGAGAGAGAGGGGGGTSDVLGSHGAAVRVVLRCAELGACASGSWDKTVRLWDTSAAGGAGARAAARAELPERVYAMALLGGGARLVVGTAGRQLLTFDLRKLGGGALASKESPLKHQTRCIEACPAGSGAAAQGGGEFLAIGCTEGRVAIDYDAALADSAAKSYAFKCHRRKEAEAPSGGGAGGGGGAGAAGAAAGETSFPVHAVAFHPQHGTFATGGGDRCVAFWDGVGRKRLAPLAGPLPDSVAALAFSPDGARLAVASSDDFSGGEGAAHAPDAVFVRSCSEGEVRPKAAAAAAAAVAAKA